MSTTQTPGDYRVTDQVGHLLRRAYQRHTAIFQSVVPALASTLPRVSSTQSRGHWMKQLNWMVQPNGRSSLRSACRSPSQ